jgi:predicted membrane protein
MNVAIFGGFEKKPFAPGWSKETVVAVLGGGDLDLRSSPPADGATLRIVAILGGVAVIVPPGTRVSLSGLSLFGGCSVQVEPGDGPQLSVSATAIFGGVDVKDSA